MVQTIFVNDSEVSSKLMNPVQAYSFFLVPLKLFAIVYYFIYLIGKINYTIQHTF